MQWIGTGQSVPHIAAWGVACKIGRMSTAFGPVLACTPEQYLHELNRQNEEAETLVRGLTEEAINWQPNGGASWSVAQCLEHLAGTNRLYVVAMRDAVERNEDQILRGSGTFQPAGWPSRKFIRSMEPPPKAKYRAFKKITPAAAPQQGDVVLTHFLAAQHDVAEFIAKCTGMDLGSLRFRNPFLKGVRLTISSGLLLIGAHNRRHLWQAENVKKNASFPR